MHLHHRGKCQHVFPVYVTSYYYYYYYLVVLKCARLQNSFTLVSIVPKHCA